MQHNYSTGKEEFTPYTWDALGEGALCTPAAIVGGSLSTGQPAATGATCTLAGYVTLAIDGTPRKIA